MPEYRLTWEIDIEANDVVTAARTAREYQLRADAQVGCFDVMDKDGHHEKVDLDSIDGPAVEDGTTHIAIELHVRGNPDDVMDVVDGALENGTIQQAILDQAGDDAVYDEPVEIEFLNSTVRVSGRGQ